LSADQFRLAATHAPVTVLVAMLAAGQVLLAVKPQWLRLLSNPEQPCGFNIISSGRWFKGVDIQQSLM
jgi:hypothetical protein